MNCWTASVPSADSSPWKWVLSFRPCTCATILQLKPGEYAILIKGIEVTRAEMMMGHLLAMDPGDARKAIEGIETKEPAFNLPALWIHEKKKDEALQAGWTVVDLPTVIATHVTETIRSYADELLTRQDVQKLIDTVGQVNPKVVEELITEPPESGPCAKRSSRICSGKGFPSGISRPFWKPWPTTPP